MVEDDEAALESEQASEDTERAEDLKKYKEIVSNMRTSLPDIARAVNAILSDHLNNVDMDDIDEVVDALDEAQGALKEVCRNIDGIAESIRAAI